MEENLKPVEEALAIAIKWEKEGLLTYLDYALKTKDVTGKNMFVQLAKDEHMHMTILEDLLDHYSVEKAWKDMEVKPSLFQKLRPKLKDLDNYAKGMEEVNQLRALEMAMKFEERSRDFYEDMAKNTDDEKAGVIFEQLADMEHSHYEILQAQQNSISGTGMWVEIAGLGMEHLVS